VKFYSNEYKPIYIGHIQTLDVFGEETKAHDLLGKLQQKLYNIGRYVSTPRWVSKTYECHSRVHAGVTPKAIKDCPPIPIAALRGRLKDYQDSDVTELVFKGSVA
jgi:hypothetical protein